MKMRTVKNKIAGPFKGLSWSFSWLRPRAGRPLIYVNGLGDQITRAQRSAWLASIGPCTCTEISWRGWVRLRERPCKPSRSCGGPVSPARCNRNPSCRPGVVNCAGVGPVSYISMRKARPGYSGRAFLLPLRSPHSYRVAQILLDCSLGNRRPDFGILESALLNPAD